MTARAPGPRDRVTAEDLNVAPALLGQPLARPGRRAAAIAIDGLCIAAFNALGNAWVALAVVALLLGLGALTHGDVARRASDGDREAAAATAGDVAREVNEALADAGVATPAPVASALLAVTARHAASGTEVQVSDAPAPGVDSARDRLHLRALQARIQAQDDELQRLRSPGLGAWQARARHWLDELGEGWLWSLLYFTLLPAGWLGGSPGQTLGKRLLGLRVAELTGKTMTPMRNLKRYGGYAAGMATGGLGLVQLLWDTNRQAIQDKTAHTVVLDLRPPPQ